MKSPKDKQMRSQKTIEQTQRTFHFNEHNVTIDAPDSKQAQVLLYEHLLEKAKLEAEPEAQSEAEPEASKQAIQEGEMIEKKPKKKKNQLTNTYA